MSKRRQSNGLRKPPDKLTPREREVLALIPIGTNKAIAQELCVQESTIEGHLHHIYRKLSVKSRTQAARYAWEHGITLQE
jgi:two-component system nitrate/nitrite response regulator NarL